MAELDPLLLRLASLPVPASLDGIDEAVLAGLAANRREAASGWRATSFAGIVALLVGLASAGLTSGGLATGDLISGQSAAAQPISPFAPNNPLAPSTLLDVHP